MADKFSSLQSAFNVLKVAVDAVSKNDKTGANDKWLNSLEQKATDNKDDEAKKKVTTLKFFDEILRSSIQPAASDESRLGRLVSEIRGYQDLMGLSNKLSTNQVKRLILK